MVFRYLGYQEKQNVSFRRKQAQRTSLRSVRGRAATKTGTIERGGLRELRFRLDSAHQKLVTICAKLVTILNEPQIPEISSLRVLKINPYSQV